ncbi:hypothetical protein PS15m_010380 [Mucor circinelloides]
MSHSSPIVEEHHRGKRPRSIIPVTSSYLNDSGNATCAACESETGISTVDCITAELTPSDYFRLALTIADPTVQGLLEDDNQDYTAKYLIMNARRLAVDQELAFNVILMLHPLLANFYKEGVSKLIPVIKKTRLHKARELKFIQSCLGDVQSETFHLVREQFEDCIRESVDLGKIMLSDMRYARLLPLLCFLMEVNSGETGDIIAISQDDSQGSLSLQLDAANYHVINDSDYDQFESSGSIVDITQDSYGFVIAPSMPDYSSYHSSSFNEVEQDLSITLDSQERTFDPFAIRYNSQTPDHSTPYSTALNVPSPISKNSSTTSLSIMTQSTEIPHTSSPPALSSSPSLYHPISLAVSQQLHLTDYEELSTTELKAKLKTYGFKTSNNRAQMIQDLKKIQTSLNNQKNSQQTSSQTIQASQSTPELSGASQVSALDPNKRKEIITHLKSKVEIWQKIAMYNTVSIDECMVGICCKRGEMKMVLDEFAAAKGTNKRYHSNN